MQRDYNTIINVIELITIKTNERFQDLMIDGEEFAPIAFMEGLCYYFHLILREVFDLDDDSLVISNEKDHIGTLIDGVVYDAFGDNQLEAFTKPSLTDINIIRDYFMKEEEFNMELVRVLVLDIKREYFKSNIK